MPKKKPQFLLTDETVNTYGFNVKTSGGKLDRFNNNPVMLFNHNYNSVIGKWVDLVVEETRMLATPEFDLEDEEAKKISGKVDRGYINGASVGIRILKWENNTSNDLITITEWELMEVSICAIPSNENAIKLYNADGKELTYKEAITLMSEKDNNKFNFHNMIELNADALLALGLQGKPSVEQISAAIIKLQSEKEKLVKQIEEARLAKEAELNAAAEKLVNEAIASKKLTPDQKESYLSFAKTDFNSCQAVLSNMKSVKLPNEQIKTAGSAVDLNDRSTWTFDDWSKKDPTGLIKLKQNDPETFIVLRDAKISQSRQKNNI